MYQAKQAHWNVRAIMKKSIALVTATAIALTFIGKGAYAISVEPKAQAFLDQLAAAGGSPIYTLTPDEVRTVLSGAQAGPVEKPAAEIEDRTVPVGPTGSMRIRMLRPPAARNACRGS
jgi:acetyl esterase